MVAGEDPPTKVVQADRYFHGFSWVHLGDTVTAISEPQVQNPVTHEGGTSVGADIAEAGCHETFFTVTSHREVEQRGA